MAPDKKDDITGIKPHILNAALCYIGILVLLPIFSGGVDHPFVKFHAKQGLVILTGEVLGIILASWISYVGSFLFLLMLVASIAGIFFALHEEKWYIPGIGTLADLFTI